MLKSKLKKFSNYTAQTWQINVEKLWSICHEQLNLVILYEYQYFSPILANKEFDQERW